MGIFIVPSNRYHDSTQMQKCDTFTKYIQTDSHIYRPNVMKQNMTVITFDIVSDQNRVYEFRQEIPKVTERSLLYPGHTDAITATAGNRIMIAL